MTARRFSYDSRSEVATTEIVPPSNRHLFPCDSRTNSVSEVALQAAAPNAVYLPQPYEPNYAYPLIVWLQPVGCRLAPLNQIMPILSDRNYLGTISRLALSVADPAKSLSLPSTDTNDSLRR